MTGGNRSLPDAYRPAVSADVPEGRACGNCAFYDESRIAADGVQVWCSKWDDWVRGDHYCDAWEPADEARAVDLTVPAYISAAAAKGVEWYEAGLAGDGVVARTVREARAMAAGEITADKVVRANAWGARHEVDLEADGARPDDDGFPSAGAVAHYLWGIPTGARYDDARAWFARKAAQVKEEGRAMATPVTPRTAGASVEFRSVTAELRELGDGSTFVGYAARFDQPSEPLPFIERIAPGAFSRSLRNRKRDVRLFVNHDSSQVLASKRSGTLRLEEDEYGLRVEADLPDTTAARDLKELIRRGVVDSMSFGFTVPRGGDRWSDDGSTRELREVVLHEVSVVTGFPAYPSTSAAVRSLESLAARTGLGVDELTDAFDVLAAGEELDPAKAAVLLDVIAAATAPAPAVEPEPAPAPSLLGLKQKELDLLARRPGASSVFGL